MITSADIKKLTGVFATKKDLEGFFSKKDGEELKSNVEYLKTDVQQLKTDVKQLKTDVKQLKGAVNNLATEVTFLRHDMDEMKENMATKDDLHQVMTALDAVLKEVLAIRQEQAAHFQLHEDSDQEIKTLKKRVDRIEAVPVVAHEIKKMS